MMLSNLTQNPIHTPAQLSSAPIDSRFSPWLMPVVYPLGCLAVLPAYFHQITVTGQENLPMDGPVLLAPTHRARWDALVVPYATGRRVTGRDLRFMVTASEVKGLQGWFIRRLGGFPVDPKNPAIGSLRFGLEALQNGEMLVIFPEGGIFRDNKVHPLKPGLARLAIQAETSRTGLGVKIVPISLNYGNMPPTWRCSANVHIGEPMLVSDYCDETPKEGARRLTAELETRLKTIDAEEKTKLGIEV